MFQLKPVKYLGDTGHIVESIGRYRVATAIHLRRTVGIKFVETDGEELHHFTRVVLIRITRGIALVVGQDR